MRSVRAIRGPKAGSLGPTVETLVLSFVPLGLGLWLRPSDPLWVHSLFPWATLAPLLCGLRHGFAYGLGSALVLTLMLAVLPWASPSPSGFPSALSVGFLLTGMLSGEFCDAWTRRLHRLAASESYSRLRLEEFSRAYHLLRASHARLEQAMVGEISLRAALERLRRLSMERTRPGQVAEEALQLLAETVPASALALHELVPRRGVRELCRIGPHVEVDGEPLVEAALRTGQLHCIEGDEVPGPIVAALPLRDSGGTLRGLLTIHDPQALRRDRLELLRILGGHVGDLLAGHSENGLEQVLRRCLKDARHGLSSVVVGLIIADKTRTEIVDLVLAHRRTLDHAELRVSKGGHPIILMVMPLTGEEGLSGYLARLDRLLRSRCGGGLEELGLRVYQRVIEKDQRPHRLLNDLYEECGVEGLNVHAA